MRAALFAFSRGGCVTARAGDGSAPGAAFVCYTMERFQEPEFLPLDKAVYGACFSAMDALIFVGAAASPCGRSPPMSKAKNRPGGAVHRRGGAVCDPPTLRPYRGANALAVELAEKLNANGDSHHRH